VAMVRPADRKRPERRCAFVVEGTLWERSRFVRLDDEIKSLGIRSLDRPVVHVGGEPTRKRTRSGVANGRDSWN
jgi:hypothetical protein